ncbi:hsp70-binding protein 1 [Anopheles darlingi]|uniref:hsp70-binding protein 1 n=1 Tax=Anopheles darlingi TaxID=43151 RepID=UPI0021000594|nr:hsp70-binding protein 1 [Anopheles darlingi]
MASGENPDNPRHPRNLQGLLKFAVEATKEEDAPQESRLQPMDEERRRFLENALNSLTVDVVKELEKAMQTLLDASSSDEAKVEAIEIVTDYVQDVDAANDFFKIGGFTILRPGLESSSASLRAVTLSLIADLAQNNPFCQQKLLEMSLLPKLTELLSDEQPVAEKALHAISCLVRHHEPCLAAFIEIGGLECILGCIQADSEKLRVKSAFLLSNLCGELEPVRDEFIKLNAIEVLVDAVKPTDTYDPKLETALSSLQVLTECKAGVERCSQVSGFREKLEAIIKQSAGKEECEDQLNYAKTLMQRCFSNEADGTER